MDRLVDEHGNELPERRKHHNLRTLFDDVVRRVEPFFKEGGGLNGSRTDFWMVRTISDAYPELSNEEAHVLVNAATRYYLERNK
ncbi:MAG: hypothetical protein PHD37_03085 [Gallionellaceae bacterium]|nr:hypothetical protein [Gallionellaceae bacterium]